MHKTFASWCSAHNDVEVLGDKQLSLPGPKRWEGISVRCCFGASELSALRLASFALALSPIPFFFRAMSLTIVLTEQQHQQALMEKKDLLEKAILKHKQYLRDDRILLGLVNNALDKYKRKGATAEVALLVQAPEPTSRKRGRVDIPTQVRVPVPIVTRKQAPPTPETQKATSAIKKGKAQLPDGKKTKKVDRKRAPKPHGMCGAYWARQQGCAGGPPHTRQKGCKKFAGPSR